MKGKFIVIYGANNLGKSTQVKLLIETLQKQGKKVATVKYPVYNLEPTGPVINEVLRKGKKMDTFSLQKLYAQNRRDYEPTLKDILNKGTWIIAEDYVGTGIVWGIVGGVKIEDLETINAGLLKEDLCVMLDGEQFKSGREEGHINEVNMERWQKAREVHQQLAERYKWIVVNANQTVEQVQKDILTKLSQIL